MAYGIFRQIFTLAERLEPNSSAIWEWVCQTPIAMLGGQTVLELVISGRGECVVTMLEAALKDERRHEGFVTSSIEQLH